MRFNVFINDTPLGRFLCAIGDTFWLSILFTLCSIPLVTIGASSCALMYAWMSRMRGNDRPLTRLFFEGFKQNWKQGTLAWLIVAALGLVIGVDLYAFHRGGPMENAPMALIFLILAVILILLLPCLFGGIAALRAPLRAQFTNALRLVLGNFPKALLMAVVLILSVLLTFSGVAALLVGISLWIAIGFGLIGRIDARIMVKILRPYLGPALNENDPDQDSL